MSVRVSIIIPVYNASQFIMRCLQSICDLPLQPSDFEVIVVDDCSTDNTRELVQKFAEIHSQIRILYQSQNHRQGAARNRGLEVACGDYVTFVDADDAVSSDFGTVVNNGLEDEIILCRIRKEDEEGRWSMCKLEKEPISVVDGRLFMRQYYDGRFIGGPCGYFFRRSFLERVQIPFAENVCTEDEDWIHIHLYLSNTIRCVPLVVYSYYFNVESTTKSCRTLFNDACRVLCSYREFGHANVYCKDDEKQRLLFYEIATYHVETTFKRLWRTKAWDYRPFYSMVGKDVRFNLLTLSEWSLRTRIMLRHSHVSCMLLFFMAPFMRMLKDVYHGI